MTSTSRLPGGTVSNQHSIETPPNRYAAPDSRLSSSMRQNRPSAHPSATSLLFQQPETDASSNMYHVTNMSSGGGSTMNTLNTAGTNEASTNKLQVVEIDSLVLMKVIKHCRDNYPTPVSGQLLGMDATNKLEVTNCFPIPDRKELMASMFKAKPNAEDLEEKVEEEMEKYQEKMTELMHDVNVDCFTVGWYQTFTFADLRSKDIIDLLVMYQQAVENAVVLGFDPLLNTGGRMAFKAYHISDKFLSVYRSSVGDVGRLNKFRGREILIEVPLVIKNPPLVEAYLLEWAMSDPLQNLVEFDTLELDHNNYLEKNIVSLSSSLEALMEEQEKLQKYQREHVKQLFSQKQLQERHKLENEQRQLLGEATVPMEYSGPAYRHIEPPSQIYTLLMSNHAELQCKEVNTVCAESLAKMYLLSKGISK